MARVGTVGLAVSGSAHRHRRTMIRSTRVRTGAGNRVANMPRVGRGCDHAAEVQSWLREHCAAAQPQMRPVSLHVALQLDDPFRRLTRAGCRRKAIPSRCRNGPAEVWGSRGPLATRRQLRCGRRRRALEQDCATKPAIRPVVRRRCSVDHVFNRCCARESSMRAIYRNRDMDAAAQPFRRSRWRELRGPGIAEPL